VIGAGPRFLSGITVYTYRLADALAREHAVSMILMRQLLPTRLYPGRGRVGTRLDRLEVPPDVRVFDGVDWHWMPSMLLALRLLTRERPDTVILQWWTGTVLHSYLALAVAARLLGAKVVIEFHEVLDVAEADMPWAQAYVSVAAPWLLRQAHGFAAHSDADRALLTSRYDLGDRPVAVLPHGPHDHYQTAGTTCARRDAPSTACSLLYFGVIRPYKGLEDLIAAFNAIPEDQIGDYWLTVAGETWENWTLPAEAIAASPYRDRITFINRYVHDDEVEELFAGADAVVLPYRRASMSGPLHVAMGYGLPLVVSAVGGLPEAVAGYDGAILVPPQDPVALREALAAVRERRGQRFVHPHSWEHTADSYRALFDALGCPGRATEGVLA